MIDKLVRLIGRDRAWRLGRALYMAARGEGLNDMATNGERDLVRRIIAISTRQPVTIVDCGGNLGEWTAMALAEAAAAGKAAHIDILEPAPAAFAALQARFAGNPAVAIHNVALSDTEGTADFHLVSPTGGTNSLVADAASDTATIPVETARGENLLPKFGDGTVDFLKIDTEGHDFAVLAGLDQMLSRQAIGAIQFEYNHRWLHSGRSMLDLFRLAERHGYRVGRADGRIIDVYDRWNAENDRFFEWNYLLLRPDVAKAIGAREGRWSEANTLVAV